MDIYKRESTLTKVEIEELIEIMSRPDFVNPNPKIDVKFFKKKLEEMNEDGRNEMNI